MPGYIAVLKYLHEPMKDWGPTDPEGRVDRYAHLAKPTLETDEDFFNEAYETDVPEIKQEQPLEIEKI